MMQGNMDLMLSAPSMDVAPALWPTSKGIELPKRFEMNRVLGQNKQLNSKTIQMIYTNYNAEFYEVASEVIWNRSIRILRSRILQFGEEFVSEMVNVDNLDYIRELPAFEVIRIARELGFIDGTGKVRLTQSNELVQHYMSRDADDEMTQDESNLVIRACVQYILGLEDTVAIEYSKFRESLVSEDISLHENILDNLVHGPYFFKKTTVRTLVNLVSTKKGAEFEMAAANFQTIIIAIWDGLISDDRYFLGLTYSQHKNIGENLPLINLFQKTFLEIDGFDYVPEHLRSLSFIEQAKKIKSAHYSFNNFYTEPGLVRDLDKMGSKVPKPALGECIGAVLMVLIGNAYGVSFAAVEPAHDVLLKLSRNDWRFYLEYCMMHDEDVLSKIANGDRRTEKWCQIAKEFSLADADYKDSRWKKFLQQSENEELQNVASVARFFRDKIIFQ